MRKQIFDGLYDHVDKMQQRLDFYVVDNMNWFFQIPWWQFDVNKVFAE